MGMYEQQQQKKKSVDHKSFLSFLPLSFSVLMPTGKAEKTLIFIIFFTPIII